MSTGAETKPYGYRFGAHELYPAYRLLLRDGEAVEIGQTLFNVLVFMIVNAGHPLSKEAIIGGAWLRIHVGGTAVATYMVQLRRLIGRKAIKTLPNQGYQTVVQIEPIMTPPPPEALPARPVTNLPPCATAAIGREGELAQLQDRLGLCRLLTLTGPSGVGKTRLAVELSWRAIRQFPEGAVLVDLGPLADSAALPSAVAAALGVELHGGIAEVEAIAAALRDRRLLLVLDNCEHLTNAVAALCRVLLDRVPGLTILATSQEPLRLVEEQRYAVKPLDLPTPEMTADATGSAGLIAACSASALFIARAYAADAGFALGDDNAGLVAEIVRGLDGVPLQLELAASLVPSLGLEGLREWVGDGASLLCTGARDVAGRHRTLLDTVERSYNLLSAAEQRSFRRLGVFRGSFTASAAAAVIGADVPRDSFLKLVEKSLVAVEDGKTRRYRLLQMLQFFAAQLLDSQGESEAAAEAHARYFAELFDRAGEDWETMPDPDWRRIYAPEFDNVRAAMDWALADPARAPMAIALTGAARLWSMLNLLPEGRRHAEKLLPLVTEATPPGAAARAFRRIGMLWRASDRQRALALFERSAALYRQLDDRLNLGSVLGLVGGDCVYLGRHAEAKAALEDARELLSGSDRIKSLINVMTDLGSLAVATSEPDDARQHYAAALDLARDLDDAVREAIVLFNQGELEFSLGAIDPAIGYARESVNRLRSADLLSRCGLPLSNLAAYETIKGDHAEARAHATEALSLLGPEGGYNLRVCLQLWALIACREERYPVAAQLKGCIDAWYARTGETRQRLGQQIYDLLSGILADNLAPDRIRALAAEGARWSEARALEITLHHIVSPEDSAP